MVEAEIIAGGTKARLKLTRGEARRLKRQADKQGIGVQELVQRSVDAHARRTFPEAFRGQL